MMSGTMTIRGVGAGMGEASTFTVGEWTVTPTRCLLKGAGRSVKVKPRTMQLLAYLANHAGEVVSVDELIGSVWQGREVSDGAIYHTINQLRRALADDKDDVRFIQTVPKQGYRLVAPVTIVDSVPKPEEADDRAKNRKLVFVIAGVVALVLAVPSALYFTEARREVLPNSVAVLPFENLSPNPDDAFIAAGIHGAILNELSKISAMNVIARTSTLQYADRSRPIAEIARELNVETVMEGSVQYAQGRVRIAVQLIDPVTRAHLWSEDYDRELVDIFAIQSNIATSIANALEAEFSLEEQASIETPPTQSPAAYALYLRALTASNRESSLSDLTQAISLDPDFALAYATRAAWNTTRLVGVGAGLAPAEALDLERSIYEDAQLALSIDPTLGVAHAALAVIHQSNWRGADAEWAFQRATELSPTDTTVLTLYARFKRWREPEEAVQLMQRAIELDPGNLAPRFQLAWVYTSARDWNAAAAAFQFRLSFNPDDVGGSVGLAFAEIPRGNVDEAVRLLQRAEQFGRPPVFRLAQISHNYALAGRPDDARRIFDQFERRATEEGVAEAWWAQAYLGVGNYGHALQRIESAVRERVSADHIPLVILAANPWSDPELERPEFRELLDDLWDDG